VSGAAVMVMPRGVGAWPGAEALWITATGWARAAEERFGAAWIATPDGAWPPGELPRHAASAAAPRRHRYAVVPTVARTLLKDARLALRQRRFEVAPDGPWSASRLRLVWEHHDLFNQAGRLLADAAGAPLVRYVHAPQVWEARKWGVRRPLWGHALEAHERRLLAGADLVACVSAAVRERLLAMGVDEGRVVVAPMAVDAERFTPTGDDTRRRLGIDPAAVVVGWCGSFRPFHGLDHLLAAFADAAAAAAPGLHLLLVGDGALRRDLEATAAAAGLGGRVSFAGSIPHAEMPSYLRAMDIAVVSSDGGGGFHYSPLKLREYAACGRAVVAPDEGELAGLGAHGFLRLHPPGSRGELAAALAELAADPARRTDMGRRASDHARRHWTWQAQLDLVMDRFAEQRAAPRGDAA